MDNVHMYPEIHSEYGVSEQKKKKKTDVFIVLHSKPLMKNSMNSSSSWWGDGVCISYNFFVGKKIYVSLFFSHEKKIFLINDGKSY